MFGLGKANGKGMSSAVASSMSGVTDIVSGALGTGSSMLHFGIKHPILSGIIGVVGYQAISGALNAKDGQSAGVAAADKVSSFFESAVNVFKGIGKGTVEFGKGVADTATGYLTNGKVDSIEKLSNDVDKNVSQIGMMNGATAGAGSGTQTTEQTPTDNQVEVNDSQYGA